MKFSELGLLPQITKALEAQGYEVPSPIQTQAIPPALKGRDVLGCAQTGTGKTCAFATPILQRLFLSPLPKERGRPVRALILTPTRELAIQIQESFVDYGKGLSLRSVVIFGGVGQAPQVEALRRGVDILVATPGRLLDLHGQKLLDLSQLEILVLDEADRMLDMGFIHDVRRILKVLPAKKQTLFFSATMPQEITELVNSLLKDPARVVVDPVSSPVEAIAQTVYLVDKGNKSRLLTHLIRTGEVKNTLVFTRTKHGANKVARDLEKDGITAAAIHGNKSQSNRQQALADFKAGRVQALVATDIAARGIDIEELSHVFNYNLPEVAETYVHRIGRTGRAGHGGAAISFCDFAEKGYLKEIEKLIGRALPVGSPNPWPMADFTLPVRDARGRVVNNDDAEARAAARERKRQEGRGAAKKGDAPAPPPVTARKEPPAPLSAGKRGRAPAPEVRAATPPAETEGVLTKSRRGVRQGRLSETEPQSPQMPQPVQHRPNPLAFDTVMDATARLLAPRPRAAAPAKGQQQEGRRGKKQTAAAPAQAGNQPRQKQEGGQGAPRQASKTAAAPAKRETGTAKSPRAAAPAKAKPPQGEKETRARRPGRDGRGPRRDQPRPTPQGQQKDSTEQPSLMKPYYISRDDD